MVALSGCGDSVSDVKMKCSAGVGDGCVITGNGGCTSWDLSDAPSDSDWLLVVNSWKKFDRNKQLSHGLSVRATEASAPLPKNEAAKASRFQGRSSTLSIDSRPNRLVPPLEKGTIGSPSSQQSISLDTPVDIYIPEPSDYDITVDGQRVSLFIPTPRGKTRTGRTFSFDGSDTSAADFVLRASTEQIGQDLTPLNALSACLKDVIPKTFDLIGRPLYDLDGQNEVNVLVTKFSGPGDSSTAGVFSWLDRFEPSPRKDEFTDSNFGEYLYIRDKRMEGKSGISRMCATTAHELQHLVSFDHKVLRRLSDDRRKNLDSFLKSDLEGEEMGLNEAYSHVVEELSGRNQEVAKYIYLFLTNPGQASLALQTAGENIAANARVRGLNTLILYHAIQKAGGTLDRNDSQTASLLHDLIQSEKTGYENLAQHFGMKSRDEFMKSFYVNLALAMFQTGGNPNFIPPMKQETTAEGTFSRGIRILSRESPEENATFKEPIFHALQFKAPLLPVTSDTSIPTQGVVFQRYRVPAQKGKDSEVKFCGDGNPISLFVVPLPPSNL